MHTESLCGRQGQGVPPTASLPVRAWFGSKDGIFILGFLKIDKLIHEKKIYIILGGFVQDFHSPHERICSDLLIRCFVFGWM